jgi:hypothetical protein
MAGADPDWFARIVSVLAFGISAATLIWSRLDKHREHRATDQASQPTVQMQWNPQVDGEGWYTLKLVFRDLSKPVLFDRVSVKSPTRSQIATWNGSVRGPSGPVISPRWEFPAMINPTMGEGSAIAHLHFRTGTQGVATIEIELKGRFLTGSMKPFEMTAVAHRT